MKKTNFTMVGRMSNFFLFFLALGAWILPGQTLGQNPNCSLACTSMTQVSLDENCDTEITWNMILNANETSCPGGRFTVKVSKTKNGTAIVSSPYVNKSHIGQTLTVEIRDAASGNRCWGQILVEDKMPPRITCENDELYCHEMRSYAGPLATDNCQKAAFLHGSQRYPWGGGPLYDDYTTSMDAVFGQGNWDDLLYSTLNPEVVFSKAYCYLYMEGSDQDGIALENFLNANRARIEQWVAEGGKLFLNAAPNVGGNINYGFGGVQLIYTLQRNAVVSDPDHPIIQGPSQPVGNTFTGNFFGHGLICPPGMHNIIETPSGQAYLIEAEYGDGHVLFGGMTASGWQQPQPNARNLKWNILSYLKNVGGADVTITLLDEDIEPINCNERYIKRVTRTYIATDASGNQSEPCTYEILLRRFPHEQVDCPSEYTVAGGTAVHCDDVVTLPNGDLDPEVYGVPTIGGIPLWPNQDFYCNVTVTYEDIDFGRIGCTRKIMRMWTVREWWCSEEVPTVCTQLIEIVDNEGPSVTVPRDMTVTTSTGYRCEALVNLPPATVVDACSPTTTVDVQYPGGFLKNQNGGQVRLPVGPNEIVYIGYDECYNATEEVMIVYVEDKTAPVAICDQHTVVGLTYDGFAHVYAQTFDDGSFDDCWIDSMAVRRMDDGGTCDPGNVNFGPYVTFCCDDIPNNNITVIFRVWDESGNYNDCMVEVTVQDKIPPSITCPPNLTISCDYHLDRNDLSAFGNVVEDKSLQQPLGIAGSPYLVDWSGPLYDGIAHDNCDLTITPTVEFDINQCNEGWIYRTFTASDPNGSRSCEQTIYIDNLNPFYINTMDPNDPDDDIVWPLDYETFESCDLTSLHPDSLPSGFGRPVADEDKCDLVGITRKDETFPFAGNNACFKIIRNWKIIDWCQFHNGRYYEWTYQQIIKVNNDVAPEIMGNYDPKSVCTYDPLCEDGEIELTATATDDCSPNRDLMNSFAIDVRNTGTFGPEVRSTGNTIDASGPYPVGKHRIKFTFEDRCGNKSFVIQEFEIVNCKAPLAYCQNGIVVDLMPMDTDGDGQVDDGMVEIWAEDFDAGSSHPCGYDLTFSFDADATELSRIYNCDSIANGNRLDVSIYITDENGNQSVCNNFIIVQDNNNACTNTIQSAVIAGRIATEDAELVSEVEVKLQGAGANSFKTKNDGAYAFPPMPYGGSYTVVPQRNDDFMNGVSTADLVAIQRHLLGMKELDSPYKQIAADANNSKDITAKDISELRKLILGIQNDLPGNTSWRFVDKSFVFNNPKDALTETWPEAYPINGLNTNMMNVDFVAVKVGDVNGSVTPNQLVGTQVRSLAGNLEFEVETVQYDAGELVSVPFYASDFEQISGYQFTLHFDREQLSFSGVKAGQLDLSEGNFGLQHTSEGMVTTSWNGTTGTLKADEPLFTLEFRANRAGSLMDELFISSEITTAEAYSQADELYGVRLKYRTNGTSGVFALYQNTPNPFADETYIRFSLESAEQANLTIYDVNGKVIRRYEIDGQKGMNEVRIASGELTASGVLYYQLDTRKHTATKRMVVLK